MENQLNQPPKPVNKTLWIALVIVILAIIGYGVYAYISGSSNNANNTNTTSNKNQVVNTNSAANTNSNVNSITNSNTNSTTNINTDISDWKTYTNDVNNFTIKYPQTWSAETVTSDTVLDHQIGDAIISNGECGTPCNIGQDICEIGITANLMPGVSNVENPRSFIQNLPSYNGDTIIETKLGGLSFYKTKVAVTPKGDDGSQITGPYVIFGKTGGTKYLAAGLSKGFSNTECVSMFDDILSTVEIN